MEAAYHLGEAGQTDRAFDLLLPLTEWLHARGRYLEDIDMLAGLTAPWTLGPRNEGLFAILQGDAWTGLGDLQKAAAWQQHAIDCLGSLAAADPSNAGWQRDLSVSLNRIGDLKSAQGDLAGALAAYQQSQGIRERLAAADPSNAGWQVDVAVSCWKLAETHGAGSAEGRALVEKGLSILLDLQAAARLTKAQQDWIALFQQALRGDDRGPWHRRLRAWLARSR